MKKAVIYLVFLTVATSFYNISTGWNYNHALELRRHYNLYNSSYISVPISANSPYFACEYYKSQAMNFCRYNSSDYDERQNCKIEYQKRWCLCTGHSEDCYNKDNFYW